MKNFITIVSKEVKELLTRQLLFSIVFMFIIFGLIGKTARTLKKETEKERITIGILDLDKSYYSQNIIDILRKYTDTKIIENLDYSIKNHTLDVIIVIPNGFSKNIEKVEQAKLQLYYTVKGLDRASTVLVGKIEKIIKKGTRNITNNFIKKVYPDKKPEIILSPILYEDFMIVNKEVKKGSPLILEQVCNSYFMIAIAVMYCIMFAGMMVITSMGQEKEAKTLETFLTIPISRTYIIVGKIIASAMVAGFMSAVYIIGFRYYIGGFMGKTSELQLLLKGLGLAINFLDYTLLGVSLFLAIIVALAGCILLGVFTQDTKSAQIMGIPIFVLTFLPFILLQFKDIESLPPLIKLVMYANPFSYPFIAAKNIIFHNYGIIIYGIVYMIILTLILLTVAVHIFNTDKVLTGRISIK